MAKDIEKPKKKLGTTGSLLIGCSVGAFIIISSLVVIIVFLFIIAEPTTQEQIDACIEAEFERYSENWLGYCSANEIETYIDKDGNETCDIPIDTAAEYNRQLGLAEDRCIERFK